jgi:hypothetical protein
MESTMRFRKPAPAQGVIRDMFILDVLHTALAAKGYRIEHERTIHSDRSATFTYVHPTSPEIRVEYEGSFPSGRLSEGFRWAILVHDPKFASSGWNRIEYVYFTQRQAAFSAELAEYVSRFGPRNVRIIPVF